MSERERFEAWISAPPYERNTDRFPDYAAELGVLSGSYHDIIVNLAWQAWQAALADSELERLKRRVAELEMERDDAQRRWMAERQAAEATISCGRYPDGSPAW